LIGKSRLRTGAFADNAFGVGRERRGFRGLLSGNLERAALGLTGHACAKPNAGSLPAGRIAGMFGRKPKTTEDKAG
jgi:hypothetical protein